MEVCSGCGNAAEKHPIVGVGKDEENNEFAAFPICLECWKDPAHRKVTLKMHFFDRLQEKVAVAMAGSPNIG